ncbi:MAG: DUF4255 domain-containing protein [Planctomycetes bacterium]|nr:DUF4255 domain-containing protein [Planctomycetota bacterium]
MSSAYAIAAVTATLRHRIQSMVVAENLSTAAGSVSVSALPPDRILVPNQPEPTQINLFLHQVTPNLGWRNANLPSRNPAGAVTDSPPLALDLHYLVTAYGQPTFIAEILLGHAMRVLHEDAILTREHVRRALSPTPPDPSLPDGVRNSRLADQVELIKIVPEVVNTEEMSRLWSALQAHYRPTAAYQVSVVLIDPTPRPRPALPVLRRAMFAEELRLPVLERVEVDGGPGAAITVRSRLRLTGQSLRGATTTVAIGELVHAPAAAELGDTAIVIDLAALPVKPRAGILAVQVRHRTMMGDPPVLHDGAVSNAVPIALRPQVGTAVAVDSTRTIEGVPHATGRVTLTLTPPVTRTQQVRLLLNETNVPAGRAPRAYTIPMTPGNGVIAPATEATAVAVPFRDVARGDYLVRGEVDGAASQLGVDGNGSFDSPMETI